jgi:superfamily II DNA or RNA helicase
MRALYAYQERTLDRIRASIAAGRRRVLVVAPTGAGKTTIAGAQSLQAVSAGQRVLFLAHRTELVDQAAREFRALGVPCGVIAAGSSERPDPLAPCQIASYDTLIARTERPPADLVIPDEAHHAVAPTYRTLLELYASALHVGLTATPERGDGVGLGGAFDGLVVAATITELTTLGRLVPVRCVRPRKRLRTGHIALSPVDAYRTRAAGSRALVFSPTVELAVEHAASFTMAGFPARCVSGDTSAAERTLYIDAFRRGDLPVLTNVAVLTEGFDAPATSTIILARGCSTTGTFDQILGRGTRAASGKTECLFLDLIGASHDHGLPSEGREYSLDGRGVRRPGEDPLESFCRVCGQVLEPGAPCPDCGYAAPPKTLRVDNAPLEPYYRTAARGDAGDRVIQRFAEWIRTGRAKGHKPTAAKVRFKVIYGRWPSHAECARAERAAAGAA